VTTPPLDLYEIAFLAGGADRVVDTALVALVESGRVCVHAPGELAVAEPARRNPVEAAVLDAVGTHGHRSIDTIRWRLADDDRIAARGRSLADSGLLQRPRFARRASWSPTPAGRQLLARLAAQPPTDHALDGGSALTVALGGREAMTDAELRASIFERPAPPKVPAAEIGRRTREARRNREAEDPRMAAHLSRNAMFGVGEGGGGFGGGDGGGF
jgi:hypothetical protein